MCDCEKYLIIAAIKPNSNKLEKPSAKVLFVLVACGGQPFANISPVLQEAYLQLAKLFRPYLAKRFCLVVSLHQCAFIP
jgi:hypothetical protein